VPRPRKRQSPLAAVASIAVALIAILVALTIAPKLIAESFRAVMLTPAPSGVDWTPADADACLQTAQALLEWPDDKGGPVTKVGLGISDDVVAARPVAVDSTRLFAEKASQLRAPGAESQLGAYKSAIEDASVAFASPITVSEFGKQYRAIGNAANDLLRQCHAVGRWVDDNYRQ
jgi:hypothetical protein